MIAHEAGVRLRRWNLKRQQARGVTEEDDAFGGYQGAIMGLMALLVGFTFGMGMDRYNTRRNLVIEETSAISGAYRRLVILPEPQRTRLADSLIRYLDSREVFAEARSDRGMAAAESRSELSAARLWIDSAAQLTGKGAPPDAGAALGAIDAMLKAAVMRREALNARVPVNVVRAMLIYAVVAAGFIGYGDKKGRRHFLPSTVQLVLLALAIGLILDLDTARTGVIRVDETPLLRVAERVRGFETERRKTMGLPPPPARSAAADGSD
ncbi:hypothetical protein [Caulobacter sp. 17J80-11]|uniref:bestrophin-like domain n=1 Tax=Caulobacter sp. 17J80-11 TaxID=2763502 RepID=UPI001653E5EB|nr:hypothetical protein [Caulobacter sp. 17J80-11]MBC6982078.1 hypothetical protein [Caulobacter sp. 17J80-11]